MKARRARVCVAWALTAVSPICAGMLDGVQLSVERGPGRDDVTLNWTGGLPAYEVYRSTAANDVTDPSHQLGETVGQTFPDTTPSGPSLFFYRIREVCPFGNCPLAEPPDPAPGSPWVGSPSAGGGSQGVHAFSGEAYVEAEDLRIRGRGPDFVWARKYRSRTGPTTSMGNGWDFSYNIRIADGPGPNLWLYDGTGRANLFASQPDGSWARREFFVLLTQLPDSSFRLTFPDTSQWNFGQLDGSPAAGKITTSVDRNGNTLSFTYDGAGRLVTISDTLSRLITVQYNPAGLISTVTDFIGRQVQYAYYQNGDAGGAFGDLKSATSPVVTGTPNGNDYPAGKTTLYTYSAGTGDPLLDHNLLTITDPKGHTYCRYVYSPTLDPGDPGYDHVARQVLGEPDDVIDLVYVALTPDAGNNYARSETIVNDRVGNVREYSYDSRNRLVVARDYTGRADPDLPTTEVDNRPAGKLRPSDPDYFETRATYNEDALLLTVDYPNGNSTQYVHELELNPAAARRSRGNLREVHRLPGALGGDQAEIVEYLEHDPQTNFVTRHVDGRSNQTLHSYDPQGNRLQTQHRIPSIVVDYEYNASGQLEAQVLPDNGSGHRRRDEFTYHSTPPQLGYLAQSIVDASGLALTTTYEYDGVGNVVRIVDPRGHDTLYAVNALDQVVRETSREVTDGGGVRYQRDTFYDANDNVVRVDVQNLDDLGLPQLNAWITTTYDHEILDRLVRTTQEVDPGGDVVTEYSYDANRNRVQIRYGQATGGSDPFNELRTLYDERDLRFQDIRAEGHPGQSTTQYDYDGNRNESRRVAGLESAPRTTAMAYDGYERLTSSTDSMENAVTRHYDANGNMVSSRVDGELIDVPGSSANVRLGEEAYEYDAMDRRIRSDVAFFDTQTQAPILDGQATTLTFYTDNSQVSRIEDDNAAATTYTYDTANRLEKSTDAKNNSTTYDYDANSNVSATTELDKADLGGPDDTLVTTYQYDNLDRRIRKTDNLANVDTYAYDSRDNRLLWKDRRGIDTRYAYDDLDRLIQTVRDMNGNGANPADPGDIVTAATWDDSSRESSRSDGKGNLTRYAYDALDRCIVTQKADGTLEQVGSGAVWTLGNPDPDLSGFVSGYDVHDNPTRRTDAVGSVVDSTYDALERPISRGVLLGPGVAAPPLGTTLESYEYDGRSRLVRAQDNDSLVKRNHDSLSHVTIETQQQLSPAAPVRTVTSTYDGVGNRTRIVYPGSRAIVGFYESLRRPVLLRDDPPGPGANIAIYSYDGPYRVERRDHGNNTRLMIGYDGIRRKTSTTHSRIVGGVIIDARSYDWDPAHNKLGAHMPPIEDHIYGYDGANRLIFSHTIPGGGPINYQLDGAANRLGVAGGPDGGPYTQDPTLPEPADSEMNQYTTTPAGSRVYDRNGNLAQAIAGPIRTFTHDYRNQLVQFHDTATGQTSTYSYDALGRRIRRTGPGGEARFYYDDRREIEQQSAANVTVATYAWGPDENELIQKNSGGTKRYYHPDDQGSPVKVTDAAGNVVEGYRYGDYGKPSFFDGAGNPIANSAIGNAYLFLGHRLDTESGLGLFGSLMLSHHTGGYEERLGTGSFLDAGCAGNARVFSCDNPTSIRAVKQHDAGGVWEATLLVQPRFTFASSSMEPTGDPTHPGAVVPPESSVSSAVICPHCGSCSGCGHKPWCPTQQEPQPDPWGPGPGWRVPDAYAGRLEALEARPAATQEAGPAPIATPPVVYGRAYTLSLDWEAGHAPIAYPIATPPVPPPPPGPRVWSAWALDRMRFLVDRVAEQLRLSEWYDAHWWFDIYGDERKRIDKKIKEYMDELKPFGVKFVQSDGTYFYSTTPPPTAP